MGFETYLNEDFTKAVASEDGKQIDSQLLDQAKLMVAHVDSQSGSDLSIQSITTSAGDASAGDASSAWISASPLPYTISTATATGEYERPKPDDMYEFITVNGSKVALRFKPDDIKKVCEYRRLKFSFRRKFPFVSIASCPYVHLELDNTFYALDCTLNQFLDYVGCDFKRFAESMLESALKGED